MRPAQRTDHRVWWLAEHSVVTSGTCKPLIYTGNCSLAESLALREWLGLV